ncbi:helix-turn-helix domain-containing protein [Viridibacillus sp. NPDC096237]|uniref:helix-turn-helix domain-containing protein n=1 Tax=Viridibacillus sp. NPDC096237 TaxID=3390721 RepID=UPI003D0184E2
MESLGSRIKKLREQQNISQKDFAKKLNVSNVVLSRYESDERKPDYETLQLIADYFEVTTDYLLGRSEIKNSRMFESAGITNEEYKSLNPYQKEVIDFFLTRENLSFSDRPERLLDALEQFEIFYEIWKKQQEKK